jgi:hypothetical protein
MSCCRLFAMVRLSSVARPHIVTFLARIRSLNYVVLSLHDLDDFDERRQAEEQCLAPFPWHITVELGSGERRLQLLQGLLGGEQLAVRVACSKVRAGVEVVECNAADQDVRVEDDTATRHRRSGARPPSIMVGDGRLGRLCWPYADSRI